MKHSYKVKVRPMSNAFLNLIHYDYTTELESATEDYEIYTLESKDDVSWLLNLADGVISYEENA